MYPIKAWMLSLPSGPYFSTTLFHFGQNTTAEPVLIIRDKTRVPAKGQFGYTPAKGDIEMHPKEHPDLFANRPQDIHPNSIAALHSEAPRLGKREGLILTSLKTDGPGTDRQIMHRLGFTDMNSVRPRINELIRQLLVREIETVKCEITGKKVRKVGV